MPEQQTRDEHADRIKELEGKVSELYDHLKNVSDRLNDVEDENTELTQTVADQEARINDLEHQLETVADLGEKAQSTPESRARDVRLMLQNQAKAKYEADNDEPGTVQWTYDQVRDNLEAHGHGKVHDWQAYDAMEDAAEVDGFARVKNSSGNKVIRASWEKITAHGAVMENNNGKGVSPGAATTNNAAQSKSD